MKDGATSTSGPPVDAPAGDGPGEVTVVGTAHISHDSVAEVEETIAEEQPDVVAVELDEGRYRQMQGEAMDDISPSDLLAGNTVFQFLAYWMLSYVQTRLGEQFDIKPGADMQAAIDTAEEYGLGLALVDRDIQVTIQRFWRRMSLREKLGMVSGLALAFVSPLELGIAVGGFVGIFAGILFAGFGAGALGFGGGAIQAALGTQAVTIVGGLVGGVLVGAFVALIFARELGEVLGAVGAPTSFGARVLTALGLGAVVGAALAATGGLALGPLTIAEASFTSFGQGALTWFVSLAAGGLVGLAAGVLFGGFLSLVVEDVDEEYEELDMSELTDGDVVSAMMEEFRRFSPGGAEALIDERDAFIAHKLVTLREQGFDVVAIVGAGHRDGILSYLETPSSLPPMESLSGTESGRRFSLGKFVAYGISLAFLAFFVLLAMAGVRNGFLLRLFGAWFLVNGVFAFGLAKLAGARWRSAGVGGAVAWMTSVNPLLAPGWFTGYVELKYSPVNMSDIGTLNELLSDEERPLSAIVSDMLDVPLFRLIVVVAMTNVGSMIASALFVVVILPQMGAEVGGLQGISDLMVEGAEESFRIIVEALT